MPFSPLAPTALVALSALGVPAPPASAARGAVSERHPMTVDDLWTFERVGAPALSPDGRWVVVPVTRFSMEKDEGQADLWLLPSDGTSAPRRLTWNEGSDGSPEWSPDGKRIAFTSKRGEAAAQLYVLPLEGGEAMPVTELPVAVQSPRWLPDGKRIVFAAATWPDLGDDFAAVKARREERTKDKTQAVVTDNRLFRYWDRWLADGSVPHLFVVDLDSRKVRDLTPGSARLMGLMEGPDFDVSPDGREVAFTANATEPPYRTMQDDVFVVPVDGGGEPRSLTADSPGDDGRARYSPDGRWLVYGRHVRPEDDAQSTRLVGLDRRTGKSVALAPGWDRSASEWSFSRDGRTLYVHAEDRGRGSLFALDLERAEAEPRRLVGGGVTAGVRAAPGGRLVYTQHSLTAPAEVFTLASTSAEPRRITSFNEGHLAALAPVSVEEVTYPGAGGHPVHAFLVLPPGFDRSRRWPMAVILHGGPHSASLDGFTFRWSAAMFASRGYVTLLPNFHGSTGFGEAFAQSIVGAHGDKPFEDVMKGVDHVLARGYVDPQRIAAAGGSYGGYLTSWILGRTDRFAALVVHAGVYDLMGQFASDATFGRSRNYGASPWEDPARIDQWSPSRLAANFRTPTLVLHGERDYRVPYTQGLNLFGVLTGKGVPSRLVVFPNENHWILKPQAARVWWTEVLGWLDRYTATAPATGATGAPPRP